MLGSGGSWIGSGGGGGGTPGGSSTQLQFNNSGVFGGVNNSAVDNVNSYVGFLKATPLAPVHAGTFGTTIAAPTGSTAVVYTLYASPGISLGLGNYNYNIWSTKVIGALTIFSSTFDVAAFTEPTNSDFDVPSASATINYAETGYNATGSDFTYNIYAIYPNNQINLIAAVTATVTDDNSSNPYAVDVSWTAPVRVADVIGYLVNNTGSNPNSGASQVLGTSPSFIDDNTGWVNNPGYNSIKYTVLVSTTLPGAATSGLFNSERNSSYINGSSPQIDGGSWSGSSTITPTVSYGISLIADGSSQFAQNAASIDQFGNLSSLSLGQTRPEIWIGPNAGYLVPLASSSSSIFLGESAGYQATNSYRSTFIGRLAGYQATNANNSNFIGNDAGNQATNAYSSNFIGYSAGYGATNANNSNFFGNGAGYQAANAYNSNFFGNGAGISATNANNSTFFGNNAGNGATNAASSNFFGNGAGISATNANNSTFFGNGAGNGATNAASSNFFGNSAGYGATSAYSSAFIGDNAGNQATNAANSIFIGPYSGYSDTVDNVSNPGDWTITLGPYSGTGGFSNSVALGRGVINSAATQMNFGNVLYITGIYNSNTQSSTPITNGSVATQSPINPNGPLTTVNGSTSGSIEASQPFQGSAYKKVIVHLTALLGTATYTFPTAFTNTPVVLTTNGLAAAILTTISTTAITATGTTTTGTLILEGC